MDIETLGIAQAYTEEKIEEKIKEVGGMTNASVEAIVKENVPTQVSAYLTKNPETEFLNVKKMGAKGDGTTDDSACFVEGVAGYVVNDGTYCVDGATMARLNKSNCIGNGYLKLLKPNQWGNDGSEKWYAPFDYTIAVKDLDNVLQKQMVSKGEANYFASLNRQNATAMLKPLEGECYAHTIGAIYKIQNAVLPDKFTACIGNLQLYLVGSDMLLKRIKVDKNLKSTNFGFFELPWVPETSRKLTSDKYKIYDDHTEFYLTAEDFNGKAEGKTESVLHFWGNNADIGDRDDVIGIICSFDFWIKEEEARDKLIVQIGVDQLDYNTKTIKQACSGNALKMETYPRTSWATSMNRELLDLYVSPKHLEHLHNQPLNDTLGVHQTIKDTVEYEQKIVTMSNGDMYFKMFDDTKTYRDLQVINPIKHMYLPYLNPDSGSTGTYCKIFSIPLVENLTQRYVFKVDVVRHSASKVLSNVSAVVTIIRDGLATIDVLSANASIKGMITVVTTDTNIDVYVKGANWGYAVVDIELLLYSDIAMLRAINYDTDLLRVGAGTRKVMFDKWITVDTTNCTVVESAKTTALEERVVELESNLAENGITGDSYNSSYNKHILNAIPRMHEMPTENINLTSKSRYFSDTCPITDAIENPMVIDGKANLKLMHVLGNHSGRIISGSETPVDYYLYPDDDKDADIGGTIVLKFGFDGDKIELIFQSYATVLLYVDEGDGYMVRHSGLCLKGTYARERKIATLFDFGSAKPRNIMVVLGLRDPFGGFVYNKLYSIYQTSDVKPLAAYIGSSLTAGGAYQYKSWNYTVSTKLGMDWLNCGEGATGFCNNAGGLDGKKKVLDRLITDVFPKKPWLLTLEGSYNDMGGGLSVDKFKSVLDDTFSAVVDNIPNCLSIVVGTFATCRDLKAVGYWDEKNNALREKALEYALPFIDTLNGKVYDSLGNLIVNSTPWFSGSGYADNLQNDGNSDLYIKNDATHFNDDGDKYVAERMLESIVAIIYAERKTDREPFVGATFNLMKTNIVLEVGEEETISYFPTTSTPILTMSNNQVCSISGNTITALTSGVTLLEATHNGVTDSCLINVVEKVIRKLESISATKTKTKYAVDDTLNVDDIVVTALYDNGTSVTVSGWTTNVTDIDMSTVGEKVIVITYTGDNVTVTQNITITVADSATDTESKIIEGTLMDITLKADGSIITSTSSASSLTYAYDVIGGNTYHLTCDEVGSYLRLGYSDAVPSVGKKITDVSVYYSGFNNKELVVPEGATHLIVSAALQTATITLTT